MFKMELITYTWNLKYGTNELIYKTETDSGIENRSMVAKEEKVLFGCGEMLAPFCLFLIFLTEV